MPGYEMKCTERSSEKTCYWPEELGVEQLGVLVRQYDPFGSGAFLLQILTTLISTRNNLLGIMRG